VVQEKKRGKGRGTISAISGSRAGRGGVGGGEKKRKVEEYHSKKEGGGATLGEERGVNLGRKEGKEEGRTERPLPKTSHTTFNGRKGGRGSKKGNIFLISLPEGTGGGNVVTDKQAG